MEYSKMQDEIINLGKLFVKELKLEPGCDTFSRWMAHYLAEKITFAQQVDHDRKDAANKECFEIILKLWEHRNSLPSGRRPFQSFEPILNMLLDLNPEKDGTYFFRDISDEDLSALEIDKASCKAVAQWMYIARDIDKTARIWIEYILDRAITAAKNERTKEWLENSKSLPTTTDTSIIKILLDREPFFDMENYDNEDFTKNYTIENLKKRIDQLEKFGEFNTTLLDEYRASLDSLL